MSTCGEAVLIEAADGRTVRFCYLPDHDVDTQHLARFRGANIPWIHGLSRIPITTPETGQRQPTLV